MFLLYQLEIDLNLKIRKHDNKPEANLIIFLEDKQLTEPLRSVRKKMKKLSTFGFSWGHYLLDTGFIYTRCTSYRKPAAS